MIYISSVYSTNATTDSLEDSQTRDNRYMFTMRKVADFMKEGVIAVSPIVHCHELACTFDLPKTHEFWMNYNEGLMRCCDKVIVLMMPFWKESKGVTHEVEYATALGKEILYVDCGDFIDGVENLKI